MTWCLGATQACTGGFLLTFLQTASLNPQIQAKKRPSGSASGTLKALLGHSAPAISPREPYRSQAAFLVPLTRSGPGNEMKRLTFMERLLVPSTQHDVDKLLRFSIVIGLLGIFPYFKFSATLCFYLWALYFSCCT